MVSLVMLCLSYAVFSFLNSHLLCFFAFPNDLCQFLSMSFAFNIGLPLKIGASLMVLLTLGFLNFWQHFCSFWAISIHVLLVGIF